MFFFLFLVYFRWFGYKLSNLNSFHIVFSAIIIYVVSTMIFSYILVKIPYTKFFLDNEIEINFLIKTLEKFTATELSVKVLAIVLTAVVAF